MSGIDVPSDAPYLLDTNVVIDFLRGALDMDDLIAQLLTGSWRPMISLVSKIELLGYPELTPHDETRIRHWLGRFEIVGLDDPIAEQAVSLKRRCRLKTPDAIIAATALERHACLVTRDKVLLTKVPGLRTVSPIVRT